MFEWLKRFGSPSSPPTQKSIPTPIKKEIGVEGPTSSLKEKMKQKYEHLYVGEIIHFYPKIGVGIIRVKKGKLKVGDMIYIQGWVTKFKQKVNSIEFNHQKVSEVGPGYEVGVRLGARVRELDDVYVLPSVSS